MHGKTLEKFILANGCGRNGKGFINELFLCMLGRYGYTCSNSVLMNPLKGGACQEVANMDNKRCVIYREPDTDNCKKLNGSTVKELTGGKVIPARGLYSSKTEQVLRATHIVECNERPKISGDIGNALVMRIIDQLFRSTFTKELNDVDESIHIYKGDDSIKDTQFQENHKYALFNILTEYWNDSGYNIDSFIPASVKERSESYDIYSYFKDDIIFSN